MNKNTDICLNAALKAGRAIMQVYEHDDFNVEMKSDNSPLTKADKKAHEVISDHLRETGYPVLSEEGSHISYEERKHWNTFWLVDPLDGTKEFIKRNGEFTVNIALIEKGMPVVGVIYVPVLHDLYLGISGKGAWKTKVDQLNALSGTKEVMRDDNRINTVHHVNDRVITVGSRSHMNDETTDFINKLKEKYPVVDTITRGSSLKLCMVAEGKAHVYPRFGPTMEWDTAAGHAIVRAAGGMVRNAETHQELRYNKPDLHNPWFIAQPNSLDFIN
jgi:3'(2'), 5'-bisphosphate nucleotidase